MTARLRFAPSPNGLLHMGHARSALYTWDAARRLEGVVLLRIEDIDLTRSRPEFVAAIEEDLDWLGLSWPEPVLVQSSRFAAYAEAAERLAALGLTYPCFCTRAEIAQHAEGVDPDGAPLYRGTCRHLAPERAAARIAAGERAQVRLDIAAAVEMAGLLSVSIVGPTVSDRPQIRYVAPLRWGDAVIVRKDTPSSYHLSVVVDDAHQAITHVTRGRDLEAATDLHVLLQRLLGLRTPIYAFHSLILDETGNKLSKSTGAPSLRSLRDSGVSAEEVRRRAGF